MAFVLTACLDEILDVTPPVVEQQPEEPTDETPTEENPPVDETPTEENPPVDETPTDETPTEENPVIITNKTMTFEKDLTKDVFETITLEVKGYNKIKITLKGESQYDIPVNINNFKVDGVAVAQTGLAGTPYVMDKAFKIGDLDAVATLVNMRGTDIGLHTYHKDKGTTHFIIVDVTDIETFEFQYKITTDAFEYLDAVVVEFIVE